MENFLLVARQVAILFVLIGLGAICRRRRLLDETTVPGLVNVLILLVTPSVVIDSFQRPFDPALLHQLGLAFVIATAAHVVAIALAYLLVRGDDRTRPVLRLATVFTNCGFVGIPLEQAILGPKGVFFGIVYIAMFNVFMWSWGLREMMGGGEGGGEGEGEGEGGGARRKKCLNVKMFINSGTMGLLIGLPLFLFSITLPEILAKPVHMMGELNTPVAMLVIGYYLAGADLKKVIRIPSVHLATFLRLVALPLVIILCLYALRTHLDRTMALAMVTAASAPVGALVSIFAAKYNRDVDMAVGLVSGSTILSIVTMPLVIALAMAVL